MCIHTACNNSSLWKTWFWPWKDFCYEQRKQRWVTTVMTHTVDALGWLVRLVSWKSATTGRSLDLIHSGTRELSGMKHSIIIRTLGSTVKFCVSFQLYSLYSLLLVSVFTNIDSQPGTPKTGRSGTGSLLKKSESLILWVLPSRQCRAWIELEKRVAQLIAYSPPGVDPGHARQGCPRSRPLSAAFF